VIGCEDRLRNTVSGGALNSAQSINQSTNQSWTVRRTWQLIGIGVIHGGYGGTRTPTFCNREPYHPLFGRMTEKNNSDFPSFSAH